ncbi:MAG: antitoxin [Streptosporangiales bacterium]|nr:antitoxin [Streptosporangiales bacterium]
MGLFDNIEGAAENSAKQGLEDKLIQEGTQKAEQFADEKTGGKFDNQIQQAGNFADQQIENRTGGGQRGQGGQDQNFGQDQNQQQGGW